jgi:hypothetical protein
MRGHGDTPLDVDEQASTAMGFVRPTFDVVSAGSGSVVGIDS